MDVERGGAGDLGILEQRRRGPFQRLHVGCDRERRLIEPVGWRRLGAERLRRGGGPGAPPPWGRSGAGAGASRWRGRRKYFVQAVRARGHSFSARQRLAPSTNTRIGASLSSMIPVSMPLSQ